jgi:hypothetical protein
MKLHWLVWWFPVILIFSVSAIAVAAQEIENTASNSSEERKQLALSLLEGVIGGTEQLRPVEYSIMTQVEAAAALWPIDKARAVSLLKKSWAALRELEPADSGSKETVRVEEAKRRRLWFFVLRKTARLSPELLEELLAETSQNKDRKSQESAATRAIMSVAWDQMESGPTLAARTAERSLSHELFNNWTNFLSDLSQRDAGEAERLARVVIDRMRDGPFVSASLLNFRSFVLQPNRSSNLQRYFLEALAVRLRRDLRPDTPLRDLEYDLITARDMRQWSARFSPEWSAEFEEFASAFETMFRVRSINQPSPAPVRQIDSSMLRSPEPAFTHEITDALSKLEKVKDAQTRDKEYERLVIKSALSANVIQAEQILSKISDEQARREATTKVYTPLLRAALKEADFTLAQTYALKISDPLGRTLALDQIGRAMAQSKESRSLVLQIYDVALARLRGEGSTEEVAKACLALAKSLHGIDPARGLDATNAAVSVLNDLSKKGVTLGDSKPRSASMWVALPHIGLKEDEVLDLMEMTGAVFYQLAKHEVTTALSVASGFAHPGLRSLAVVAICKPLLAESAKSSDTTTTKNQKN